MMARPTSKTRVRRDGFTLPEILVTITLIAMLAAVVVPTIASQIKKGDPARVGSDFIAIRGGVEQFLTDVRRYPKTMAQLTAPIVTTAGSGPLVGPTAYGALDSLRWRGPYLNKDGAAALTTGYGLTAISSFIVDSLTTTSAASCATPACGQKYMTLMFQMPVNDSLSILDLDRQYDDGVLATGIVRYEKGASKDTLKLLLMPIY
jgi:prepilin-type N-terminal cleavage/methylation domain-containing protein